MAKDGDQEPMKVKWWNLAVRPRADMFTKAAWLLILSLLAAIGALKLPSGWRMPFVMLAIVFAVWGLWRAWRMPPDPPIEIVG